MSYSDDSVLDQFGRTMKSVDMILERLNQPREHLPVLNWRLLAKIHSHTVWSMVDQALEVWWANDDISNEEYDRMQDSLDDIIDGR